MSTDTDRRPVDAPLAAVPEEGSRPSSRRVLQATLFAAAAAIPLLLWDFGQADLRRQLILAVASLVLLCLAGLQLVTGIPGNARGIARWRTGPWFLLWVAIAFGVASLTWLGPQTGSSRRVFLASVIDALLIVEVAVILWTVGYLIGPPKLLRATCQRGLAWMLRGTRPEIRGGAALPWVLYGVGSAARLATLLLSGGFGYLGDPTRLQAASSYGHLLSLLSTMTIFAIATAAYRAFTTRELSARVAVCVLFAVEVVVGAVAGGKESFLISVLVVLIPYGAVNGRISLRILAAAGLLFLTVAVPFNVAYRPVVRSGADNLTTSEAVEVAPAVLSSAVEERSFGPRLTASAVTMFYRIREIDNVAIISQKTPSLIPYRNPVDFAAAPVVALIPRAIWPGKPVLATGHKFSQEYYGLPGSVHTSSAITPIGDLYRHGGWITLACGMALLGLAFRLFDGLFLPELDPRAIFFLLVFLPTLVKSEVDIFGLIVSFPTSLLIALLGAHLVCRKPGGLRGPSR